MKYLIYAIACGLLALGLIALQNRMIVVDKQNAVDTAMTQGVMIGKGQQEYEVAASTNTCEGTGWTKSTLLATGGYQYTWCNDNGANGKYESLIGKWHIYNSPDGVTWSRW